MAARPLLPVLAALLLSAAPEPVPRVSLPYGECPRGSGGGGSAGTAQGAGPRRGFRLASPPGQRSVPRVGTPCDSPAGSTGSPGHEEPSVSGTRSTGWAEPRGCCGGRDPHPCPAPHRGVCPGTRGTCVSASRAVVAVLCVSWTGLGTLLTVFLGWGTPHSPSLCPAQLRTALSPTAGTCQLLGPGMPGAAPGRGQGRTSGRVQGQAEL